MVAVIHSSSSINRILQYNEQKVKEGLADCMLAASYPKEHDQLSFTQKLNRLKHQVALNENVTRNAMHISLNFDPAEKLSTDQLKDIAGTYMEKIGFGDQPYLVYQHHDAGHPHLHIVSIKIKADGKRIDTQNIGRNQSEKARKEIEIAFGLKKAADSKQMHSAKILPVDALKIVYGKTPTKRAITNVLAKVIDQYRYSSLPELNAVLKLYNVTADAGSEGSRICHHHGLTYRVLDEKGNKTGVPVKASDIYFKPTLPYLEKRFPENNRQKQPHSKRIKNAIDWILLKNKTIDVNQFSCQLEKESISTVLRQNAEGRIYGITFIDHQSKTVLNGSDIGKNYSANSLLERMNISQQAGQKMDHGQHQGVKQTKQAGEEYPSTSKEQLILHGQLIQPENLLHYIPAAFKKRRKRLRRINI